MRGGRTSRDDCQEGRVRNTPLRSWPLLHALCRSAHPSPAAAKVGRALYCLSSFVSVHTGMDVNDGDARLRDELLQYMHQLLHRTHAIDMGAPGAVSLSASPSDSCEALADLPGREPINLVRSVAALIFLEWEPDDALASRRSARLAVSSHNVLYHARDHVC
jgi:hypothetical protein